MTSQVMILKINCMLSANQKRDNEFNVLFEELLLDCREMACHMPNFIIDSVKKVLYE